MKKPTSHHPVINSLSCLLLSAQVLSAALDRAYSTDSMKVYKTGMEQLVVYTDVPGHSARLHDVNTRAKSDVYEIRVRSAATNNEWVQCFANYTYNRVFDLPVVLTGQERSNPPSTIQAYLKHNGGWSQTYANIEMSEGSTVEVEISKIGDILLDGVATIEKSSVHPSHKVFDKRDEKGKVYFKLKKACQVVIDINGMMDDHNTAFPEHRQVGPVHSVSLFANPILEKPPISGEGIRYVNAGTMPDPTPDGFTTMVFGPGVHFLNAGFPIHPNKSYYIPGDAIIFGSLANTALPAKGSNRGDNISITGYGTLNGMFNPHYEYKPFSPSYPQYNGKADVGIHLESTNNLILKGLTITDPANFCTRILPRGQFNKNEGKVSWVKAISWRVNGDGLSVPYILEDCFMRTSDDNTALYNDRRRCTFWKDSNANIMRFKNWREGDTYVMEDCDILYHRRRPGAAGAVFTNPTAPHLNKKAQITVDATIRNIRFHDRMADMELFSISSIGSNSFHGLKFENISFFAPIDAKDNGGKPKVIRNKITGSETAPWNEGLTMKKITINHNDGNPPVVLTKENFTTYFDTNEHVHLDKVNFGEVE